MRPKKTTPFVSCAKALRQGPRAIPKVLHKNPAGSDMLGLRGAQNVNNVRILILIHVDELDRLIDYLR